MRLEDFNRITLKINGEELLIDLSKEFSFSGGDLERVPATFSYLMALKDVLYRALNNKRSRKEEYYATQFLIIKEDFDGSRPPSDEYVRQEIQTDKKYITLQKAFNKAIADYTLISDLVEAYKLRAEVLRTLSANSRKRMEMET